MRQALICLILLAGCATEPPPRPVPERIILLPSTDGRASSIVVTTNDRQISLATPYAVAEAGAVATATTADEVDQRYGRVIAMQPKRPRVYTLHFVFGSDELTAESRIAFEQARSEIASFPGAEVIVIGHTDRVGAVEFNDALSRKRAETVASRLIAAGVSAERIAVAGRGEREPLIPTNDEVAEPRNRRVEIKVR